MRWPRGYGDRLWLFSWIWVWSYGEPLCRSVSPCRYGWSVHGHMIPSFKMVVFVISMHVVSCTRGVHMMFME